MITGLVFLLVVGAISAEYNGSGKCEESDRLPIDAKFLEGFKDNWKIMWSTEKEQDECTTFQYFAGREGSETVDTAVYRKVNGAKPFHSARMSETNEEQNQWICTKDNEEEKTTYYATFIDQENPAFILITCNDDNKVASVHAIATDDGKQSLEAEIKEFEKFYGQLDNVWENCQDN